MRVSPTLFVLALTASLALPLAAQDSQQSAQPVFRAGVDLVTVAAVVRDKQGRVVPSLTRHDFTVLDGGEPRPIVDFQSDARGPISIGLLMDSSGSMSLSARLSRSVGEILLTQLDPKIDDIALLTFDTRLLTLRAFTNDFTQLRRDLVAVEPFGATSIYDAIAGAAGVVDQHTRKRRAVLVVTDGSDNWSSYSPEEVAWIASSIDVPVYVLAVTPSAPGAADAHSVGGELGDVARATGGLYFSADNESRQAMALGRILEDLRHQYLIAFEPASARGLRPLQIRTTRPALKVRARQWYSSEPLD